MQALISARLNNEKKIRFTFNSDSSFNKVIFNKITSKKYYINGMDICIDEGKGYLNYPIKMVIDSFFKFLNKNNMMYVLK